MLIRVLRGQATAEEERLVKKAVLDPHSEVNDWLEAMESWAQRVFRRTSRHAKAADKMLREGAGRQDFNDVVAFIHMLTDKGTLTKNESESLLRMNPAPESGVESSHSADYRALALRMLRDLIELRPDLATDVQRIRENLDRGLGPSHDR